MRFIVGVGASGPLAEANVAEGLARLRATTSLRVLSASRAYANPAFGGVTSDRFVNAAVVVECALGAGALLRELHAIERALGRVRGAKNGPRALDLDVLWSLDAIGATTAAASALGEPQVPHPRFLERPSAVIPAVEALVAARLPVPMALADAAQRAATARMIAVVAR